MMRQRLAAFLQQIVDVLDTPASRAWREAQQRAELAEALQREVERTQRQHESATRFARRLRTLR